MTYSSSATHLPVLKFALERTTGAVLELGVGHNSTPIIHETGLVFGRDIISVDNNLEWLKKFVVKSKRHAFMHVESWDQVPYEQGKWGLAFVDQSPGAARAPSIRSLAWSAQVIVAHDSEPEEDRCYQYSTIRHLFLYSQDWTLLKPHTLILSNYVDVSRWVIPV